MQGLILAICLALTAACYSPTEPDCGFACREGSCPGNYFCAPDKFCHKNGTSPTAACGFDARIDSPRPIDAPRPDGDITPPMLLSSMPANGEMNIPITGVIHVFFTEPVSNVNISSFLVSANSATIQGSVGTQDPTHYVFSPQSPLPSTTTINVTLTGQIVDYAANPLTPDPTTFSFMTAL